MTDTKTRGSRLVLTGALGRVCSTLGPSLSERYELIPADKRAQGEQSIAGQPVQPLDITDFDATCALLEGSDYVVHTAIAHEPEARKRGFAGYVEQMMRVNAMGPHYVLEAAHRAGVKRVVLFSSLMTMLGKPRLDRITDHSPPRPAGLYGCTKLFNEHLADYYHREKGLSVFCLRLGMPMWDESGARYQETLKNIRSRGLATHPEDIAQAVLGALTTEATDFAIAHLTSDSDPQWIDLTGSEQIGYRPTRRYTAHGVELVDQVPATAGA